LIPIGGTETNKPIFHSRVMPFTNHQNINTTGVSKQASRSSAVTVLAPSVVNSASKNSGIKPLVCTAGKITPRSPSTPRNTRHPLEEQSFRMTVRPGKSKTSPLGAQLRCQNFRGRSTAEQPRLNHRSCDCYLTAPTANSTRPKERILDPPLPWVRNHHLLIPSQTGCPNSLPRE